MASLTMDLGMLWIVLALSIGLVGAALAAMAIGVLFRRPCLRGSCGGVGATGPGGEDLTCAACPNRKRVQSSSAPRMRR